MRADNDMLYGGDPCPVCGVTLDYEEWGDEREPEVEHPDPQCGWRPDGYPSTHRGWVRGRDPDAPGIPFGFGERSDGLIFNC